jgi:hypothetical protein
LQRSIALTTLRRVSSETNLVLLSTCETVAVETPASRATSLILMSFPVLRQFEMSGAVKKMFSHAKAQRRKENL